MSYLSKLATKAFLLLLCCFLLTSQLFSANYTPELEKALQQACKNRISLEQVLKHYANNKEKYQAACFLIVNMVGHSQAGRVVYYDPQIDVFRRQIDSAYYAMVKGKTNEKTNTDEFKKQLSATDKMYRDKIEAYSFKQAQIAEIDLSDIQTLDANFLIRHIDNAFDKRKKVKFARQLSFQDFCSYVLPYRVINDYPLVQESKLFTDFFSKYLQADKVSKVNDVVERYNQTASRLRWFMGKYPFETNIGFNELFFNSFFDCVDVAHYGASALRAAGIPVAVEYNSAYKLWSGRHYFVSTLDSAERWCTFSPESGLPIYKDPKFREALNIYRIHFDKQKNNPSSLKSENEYLPDNFIDPYIEDVTKNIMNVVSIKLPFAIPTTNRLAYLASFQSEQGLTTVTWGKIDTKTQKVNFENVVPDNLYFPMYMSADNKLKAFGDPFWIKTDSTSSTKFKIIPFTPQKGKILNVDLLRKFPQKPNMQRLAENLIGSVVIASDNPKFTNADTLAKISVAPIPYWQELDLKNTKAYRYYRIETPKEHPHFTISELEFVTRKSYNYSNTMSATRLAILHTEQINNNDSNYVRLLDDTLEKLKVKSEYDGNVQTAPEAYPTLNFRLKEPQVVTSIRFVPKNEDNGIQPGDSYSLSVWNGSDWQWLFTRVADYQHIHADGLQVGRLYWLRNRTKGTEETPFVIDERGNQKFIYEDELRILQP